MNCPTTAAILIAAMTVVVPVLGPYPQTTPSASAGCAAPAQRVEEERFVPVGGIPQWITTAFERSRPIMREEAADPVGKRMSVVAPVTDSAAIGKILDHLGLSNPQAEKPPPPGPGRDGHVRDHGGAHAAAVTPVR